MIEPRRRGRLAAALALAALVGLVLPVAEVGSTAVQASVVEDPAPVLPEFPTPEPSSEAEEEPEAGATGSELEAEVGGPIPQAPQPAQPIPRALGPYGVTWTVVDEEGRPMPGATVMLEGPRATSSSSSASWGRSRPVTDCEVAPCDARSMDQDPRPGVFKVDRFVDNAIVTPLTNSVLRQRFRITPSQAPSGYTWVSPATVFVPPLSSSRPGLPSPNPWAEPFFNFGSLVVQKPELTCSPNNLYSMGKQGQLQRVVVDRESGRGVVSNVGMPAQSSGVKNFNGLAVGAGGEYAYAFNRLWPSARIFRYDVVRAAWALTEATIEGENLVAGAIDPAGTYWAGEFTGSTGFRLWSMTADGKAMERRGEVDLSAWRATETNGDMVFDGEGNLYIVRGSVNDTLLNIFRVDAQDLEAGRGENPVPVSALVPSGASPFRGINGVAYDSLGFLYLGGTGGLGYLTAPAANVKPTPVTLSGATWDTTDLASCAFPPTVKLEKQLPGGRVADTDQFTLEISSGPTIAATAQTSGTATGLQPDAAGPVPVTSGVTIAIAEKPLGTTSPGDYAASWECRTETERVAGGAGTSGSFTVPVMRQGGEIRCTFTNEVVRAEKTATPASGIAVNAGEIVRYDLTLDNSGGMAPATVDFWDSLTDVLDDAVFVNAAGDPTADGAPEVSVAGGISYAAAEDWNPAGQWLRMRGTVAAGDVGSLSFAVRVLPNSEDAGARQESQDPQGFFLRNRLVRGSGGNTPPELPTTCAPGVCTEHPVNAWSVEKDSVPAEGTRLAKGGNVHYRVAAEKINAGTSLANVVLQDDLTHVFKTAGWAPDAVPAVGALGSGVYLFDAAGRSLGLDGLPNTAEANVAAPVQSVSVPEQRNVAEAGNPPETRWILTSGAPLTLPAEAVRAEMWFAVQAAESPAGIPDPQVWQSPGATPVTGWTFVNYATGTATGAAGEFAPNECVTGLDVPHTALAADAEQPADPAFPDRCRVQQDLAWNSFTLRKDAGGLGVAGLTGDLEWGGDPTGLWNMVGHEFEIRDSVGGAASAYPSVQLCRTDYDPEQGWNGDWIAQANAGDASRWDFATQPSQTQQRVLAWNNAHPDDPRPVCGTLAELTAGPQQGQWFSEGLGQGEFWLVETRAPSAQRNPETGETRAVPGVQRLAEAIPFTVWPDAAGPEVAGGMRGRGQVDIGHSGTALSERCDAAATVAERPTACVDRAGYFMVVQDPAPAALPFTGGRGRWVLSGAGALVLMTALAGIARWRSRSHTTARHAT
ncbi:hypothetical protein ACI1US_00731 [Leucobacter sp. BZR 635]